MHHHVSGAVGITYSQDPLPEEVHSSIFATLVSIKVTLITWMIPIEEIVYPRMINTNVLLWRCSPLLKLLSRQSNDPVYYIYYCTIKYMKQ